jgi:hypothetical protein
MFFRYHASPAKLLRLFRQFRNQARRLHAHRSRYGAVLLALCAAYGLASLALAASTWMERWPLDFPRLFGVLGLSGVFFLAVGWGFAANFGHYPRRRHSPGGRVGTIFGLLIIAGTGLLMLSNLWDSELSALLRAPEQRPRVLAVWAWTGLGLFLLSRWIVWLRLQQVCVQEFELDFLDRVVRPLLRDLPPEASCTLGCNPFSPVWTRDFTERKAGFYIYHGYNDILLDFRVKLADGGILTLRTLHRRIDKFKQARKLKDKGSKHRITQIYRLEHPALRKMSAADGDRFRALAGRWPAEGAGYESAPRRDPAAGRLVVVQKRKFAAARELGAGDLPKPALVLGTVRELSGFAAELAGSAAAASRSAPVARVR